MIYNLLKTKNCLLVHCGTRVVSAISVWHDLSSIPQSGIGDTSFDESCALSKINDMKINKKSFFSMQDEDDHNFKASINYF